MDEKKSSKTRRDLVKINSAGTTIRVFPQPPSFSIFCIAPQSILQRSRSTELHIAPTNFPSRTTIVMLWDICLTVTAGSTIMFLLPLPVYPRRHRPWHQSVNCNDTSVEQRIDYSHWHRVRIRGNPQMLMIFSSYSVASLGPTFAHQHIARLEYCFPFWIRDSKHLAHCTYGLLEESKS